MVEKTLSEKIEEAIQGYIAMTPEEREEMAIKQGLTPEQIAQQETYVSAIAPTTTPTTPTTTPTTPTTPTVPPIIAPTITTPPPPTPPTLPPVPTLVKPTLPEVPTVTPPTMPEVTPVPPYEKSPEQIAFEEMTGGYIRETLEMGGRGIDLETQAQMIQRTTDILKARETENIRVMKNNMERQQITNSGFVFANEQTIKSNTTVSIANNIRDVQISSALMKLASFETAMGQAAKFIGYLADESLKAYAPKLAQWEKEAQYALTKYGIEAQFRIARAELKASYGLAKYGVEAQYGLSQAELEARYGLAEYGVKAEYGMAGYQAQVQASIAQFQVNAQVIMNEWQANFDLMKIEINQEYKQGNMELANQLLQTLQDDQQAHNILMAEMEIETANAIAEAEGAGSISGTIIEGLFTFGAAIIGL